MKISIGMTAIAATPTAVAIRTGCADHRDGSSLGDRASTAPPAANSHSVTAGISQSQSTPA